MTETGTGTVVPEIDIVTEAGTGKRWVPRFSGALSAAECVGAVATGAVDPSASAT